MQWAPQGTAPPSTGGWILQAPGVLSCRVDAEDACFPSDARLWKHPYPASPSRDLGPQGAQGLGRRPLPQLDHDRKDGDL